MAEPEYRRAMSVQPPSDQPGAVSYEEAMTELLGQ
jgi:hypothetical protein